MRLSDPELAHEAGGAPFKQALRCDPGVTREDAGKQVRDEIADLFRKLEPATRLERVTC
jgi:hypothetical protein